jgi:sec-independent protein translocase protein TatA
MFGISGEHLLILGIVLLIFGPRRLPELGNTLGKAIRNFKDAISGVEEAKYRKLEENAGHTPQTTAQSVQQPQAAPSEARSPQA